MINNYAFIEGVSIFLRQLNRLAILIELIVAASDDLFRHTLDEYSNAVVITLLVIFALFVVDGNNRVFLGTAEWLVMENTLRDLSLD